jgi:hypothetical protein
VFLGIVIVEAAVVFAISDEAFGEWIMVVPLVVTLAVLALTSLPRRVQLVGGSLLAALAAFNFAMTSGVFPTLGDPRELDAGPFGRLPLTDGRQDIQQRLESAGYEAGRPGDLPDGLRRWPELHQDLAAWMLRYAAEHDQRPVVFGIGNESRLLNTNDLLLYDRLIEDNGLLLIGRVFLEPTKAQFDDPKFGLPNFAMTFLDAGEMSSTAPLTPAEKKIRSFGFRIVRTVQLADRPARIWWRSQADVTVARGA